MLPWGTNPSLLGKSPLHKGGKNSVDRAVSPESVSIPLKLNGST